MFLASACHGRAGLIYVSNQSERIHGVTRPHIVSDLAVQAVRSTGGVRSTPPTGRSAGIRALTVLGIGFPDAPGATLPGKAGEQAVAFPDKIVVRNAAFGVARK